jgi:hypothetical protein
VSVSSASSSPSVTLPKSSAAHIQAEMSDRAAKKRKVSEPPAPRISDPRFANVQSDPRFRLPGKKNRVKVDKRFARALEDDDFSRRSKVDRYGRPLEADSERKRLKRKYDFEGDSEDDEPDDDDEVQKELRRVGSTTRDVLREGRDQDSDSSSSSESSSEDDLDDDVEESEELSTQTKADVPTGEISSRIAVVNLDWDNIRAEDLMAVISSFLDAGSMLLKVAIYPSEFGKERMQREEMEGPPKEIFAINANSTPNHEDVSDVSESEEEDDEAIKQSLLNPDDGTADFDSQALRRYQLERLRYFYAVLTFSSPSAAKHIYDTVDGTEYLSTANFFDLRFVPDDTDFSDDTPREECRSIPPNYKPNEFITDALQHSKVKLTWDAEDTSRKEAAAQAFRSKNIRDLDGVDLAAYIGSDSESEAGSAEEAEAEDSTKKQGERQKMRSLLGLAAEPTKGKSSSSVNKNDRAPIGNVEITFSAGLSATNGTTAATKRSVFANSPEPEETTIEKYVRKEKERKARRREKARAARGGALVDESDDDAAAAADADAPASVPTKADGDADGDGEDLGFNDPFFSSADASTAHATSAANAKAQRKEDRLKKRAEREAEEAAERSSRAQLEALMADNDNDNDNQPHSNAHNSRSGGRATVRHFDMREVEKAEKAARKKEKARGKAAKQLRQKEKVRGNAQLTDGFQMDTADPRFAGRLYGSHEFAIDPTNPRFKGTKGMQALLEEGRRRKGRDVTDAHGQAMKAKDDDVQSLVAKIKKKKGVSTT